MHVVVGLAILFAGWLVIALVGSVAEDPYHDDTLLDAFARGVWRLACLVCILLAAACLIVLAHIIGDAVL